MSQMRSLVIVQADVPVVTRATGLIHALSLQIVQADVPVVTRVPGWNHALSLHLLAGRVEVALLGRLLLQLGECTLCCSVITVLT